MIYLPPGSKLKAINNDLVEFPEGTILVKTFFYFKDKRNPALGKKIIETRLLVKKDNLWNVATYMWNETQDEANLLTIGYTKNINWLDENGKSQAVAYKIPKNDACVTCHLSNNLVMPLGPKIQNLNRDVNRNDSIQNQLNYFSSLGLMEAVSPSNYFALPNYGNTALSRVERARAYMEINCAHCHRPEGYATDIKVNLLFATSVHDLGLGEHADHFAPQLEKGKMPKLGTTIVDTMGVNLMKDFLKSLHH